MEAWGGEGEGARVRVRAWREYVWMGKSGEAVGGLWKKYDGSSTVALVGCDRGRCEMTEALGGLRPWARQGSVQHARPRLSCAVCVWGMLWNVCRGYCPTRPDVGGVGF